MQVRRPRITRRKALRLTLLTMRRLPGPTIRFWERAIGQSDRRPPVSHGPIRPRRAVKFKATRDLIHWSVEVDRRRGGPVTVLLRGREAASGRPELLAGLPDAPAIAASPALPHARGSKLPCSDPTVNSEDALPMVQHVPRPRA